LINPDKLSEQLFITLCALPEGYKQSNWIWTEQRRDKF